MVQVRTYSDWVIDGDYDWPPKCAACQAVIEDEDTSTTRLGCLRELYLYFIHFSSSYLHHLMNFLTSRACKSSLSVDVLY